MAVVESVTDVLQDKRAHHNALERKRRDHIKDSFTSLRDSIPSLNGEKIQVLRFCCFLVGHSHSLLMHVTGISCPDPEEGC